MTLMGLPRALIKALADPDGRAVEVQGDSHLRVVRVLDAMEANGVWRVCVCVCV